MIEDQENKLTILFLRYFIVSFLVSAIIFGLSGHGLHLTGSRLDLDFFNTFCGVITIIGFVIAIYQISALRGEQQVRKETAAEVTKSLFIEEARFELGKAYDQIFWLKSHILNDGPYSENILKGFISKLDILMEVFSTLDQKQINIDYRQIQCDKCLTLIAGIETILQKNIEEDNNYISIKRQSIIDRLRELGEIVFACQESLKTRHD